MPIHNIVSIATNSGFKNIEIHHDDLSQLSWPVDVLVISTFRGGYVPTPGTVIEALQNNRKITVSELAKNRLFDFRDTLNAWVSQKIEGNNFNYIICLEGMSESFFKTGNLEPHFEDLLAVLSVLQHKGLIINSVALPFLGTGQQGIAVGDLIPILIKKSKELLETVHNVQTIYFVHPRIDYIELVDQEINQFLHRRADKLELIRQDIEIATILDRISAKLITLKLTFEWTQMKAIDKLSFRILQEDIKFYELGILSRIAMESILKALLASEKQMTLSEMVYELNRFKLSTWMLSYIHTVRSFGNFLVHDTDANKTDAVMTRNDILFFTQAFERSLDIIQEHCRNN